MTMAPEGRKPETFLPLTQTSYYILASLAGRPRHGYSILKEVEALSNGTVRLGIGNTYAAIKRLLEQGLVEREDDLAGGDERRKVYRLTGLGERVVHLEYARIQQMAKVPLQPVLGIAHP